MFSRVFSRVLARNGTWFLAAVLAAAQGAQAQDATADITSRINALFVKTKITADGADIVTAGTAVKFAKDGMLMCSVSTPRAPESTYKDGKISFGMGARMTWGLLLPPGTSISAVPQRKFVAGENVWVYDYKVGNDAVVVGFISDPLPDTRYYGFLKFPFNKKSPPSADAMMATIAEVFAPVPSDAAPAAAAAAPAAAPPAMAPIAPPPPPPDAAPPAPQTVTLGLTKDQVVAILGQPQKVYKLGNKEVDSFPDLKVTFTSGKVTDAR
jgi:hypothetical protein